MQTLVRLQNVAHKLERNKITKLGARVIELIIRLVYGCYLPAGAKIDPTVHFHHNGLAVVVNKLSVIGPNCQIGPQVVLGGRSPIVGAPKLEADVVIHSGAKLIGPITLAQGCIVGANAVVISDVPAFSTAVGVPAKIIQKLT
ncbi:serine O-acetyltransferase [Yoonia maritima]|uniref:Serine O-acetyltransferase n=1 Tax=Yoonia maritima TaxID=1435347 RepID=A0A2T0VT46_9RHOB|nr:serine acetyltransferase [Yoonia maritima]PRY74073.1 serine O-acetyltransferase [Yoonia maritima]